MQTICTSLQTDNHINTSSLDFYRPDALPDAQPTVTANSTESQHLLLRTCYDFHMPTAKVNYKTTKCRCKQTHTHNGFNNTSVS